MSKRILLLSLASFVFFACKSNKETATAADSTQTTQTKNNEVKTEPVISTAPTDTPKTNQTVIPISTEPDILKVAPVEDIYRLTVVFFSIGSGTDNKAMTAFEDLISDFAVKSGKNIDYEKTPWGREGETDYCLRLNELDAASQADFVKQTNETLKNAKWVHIYENQPCKHKRKR